VGDGGRRAVYVFLELVRQRMGGAAGQDAVWLAAVHVDASRDVVVGAANNELKLTCPATLIRSRLVRTELLEAGIRRKLQ